MLTSLPAKLPKASTLTQICQSTQRIHKFTSAHVRMHKCSSSIAPGAAWTFDPWLITWFVQLYHSLHHFPTTPRQHRPPYQSFPFRPLPASSRDTLSSPNYMSCHVFWTQHKIYSLIRQPPPPGTTSSLNLLPSSSASTLSAALSLLKNVWDRDLWGMKSNRASAR